jgi:voltage-gated potassium channel
MSTVGYGDILPASDSIRVIVAAQIMAGVILLLFGVTEILRYARERGTAGGGR